MTHDEMRELLAGYAIDGLADSEAAVVAEHLAWCADCSLELRSLQETVDALAGAVPQLAPPERLRARVLLDAALPTATVAGAAPLPAPDRSPRAITPVAIAGAVRAGHLLRRAMAVAAVLALVALSATTVSELSTIKQMQEETVQDRAALGLLTVEDGVNLTVKFTAQGQD